jgi:hypothetical protein
MKIGKGVKQYECFASEIMLALPMGGIHEFTPLR